MWPFDKFRKKKKPEPRKVVGGSAAPVKMSGGYGLEYEDNIIPMATYLSMYDSMAAPTPPEPDNRAPHDTHKQHSGWHHDGSYTYPDHNVSHHDTSSSFGNSSDSSSSYDSGSSSYDSGSSSSDSGFSTSD